VLNDRYHPDGSNMVHCNIPCCSGICILTTRMVQLPVILVIEPKTSAMQSTHRIDRCPLLCMNDIEHELIIHDTWYMLVQVMLQSRCHFCGVAVTTPDTGSSRTGPPCGYCSSYLLLKEFRYKYIKYM
jgi:hypothetical protein